MSTLPIPERQHLVLCNFVQVLQGAALLRTDLSGHASQA